MSGLSTTSEAGSPESPDKDADSSSVFSGDHPLSSFSQVESVENLWDVEHMHHHSQELQIE